MKSSINILKRRFLKWGWANKIIKFSPRYSCEIFAYILTYVCPETVNSAKSLIKQSSCILWNYVNSQAFFAKNIIRRKFSWFQIEKIRQKSHRLSVSELAISGFWDLEITNFCSPDIRAKCLICVFWANKIIKFSPKIFGRDVCLNLTQSLSCNSQSLCSPHTIF